MPAASLVLNLQPLEQLESSLVQSLHEVTRAEHRSLVLLREFDLRRGWEAYGNNDCAEWLNWRCGISRTTAQEKVRVARALTRVATDLNETELLSYALELVLKALERVGSHLPDDPTRSLFAKGADALVQMARESLAGGREAVTGRTAVRRAW